MTSYRDSDCDLHLHHPQTTVSTSSPLNWKLSWPATRYQNNASHIHILWPAPTPLSDNCLQTPFFQLESLLDLQRDITIMLHIFIYFLTCTTLRQHWLHIFSTQLEALLTCNVISQQRFVYQYTVEFH